MPLVYLSYLLLVYRHYPILSTGTVFCFKTYLEEKQKQSNKCEDTHQELTEREENILGRQRFWRIFLFDFDTVIKEVYDLKEYLIS